MNAEGLAVPLAVLLVLATAGPALGQSLAGQVDEAAAKAERLGQQARQDPQETAANATDPSWQGRQANWTKAWTCTSLHAADDRAGEAGEQALDCPAPGSARAGEEEQDDGDGSTARAEEAGADAERASRDAIAAIQAFIADTSEDPDEAPQHAATLANRTLAIVHGLVDGLTALGGLGVQAASLLAHGVAQPFLAAGQALAHVGGQALAAAQAGLATAHDGIEQAASAAAHAPGALAEHVQDGWAVLTAQISGEPTPDEPVAEDPAEGTDPIETDRLGPRVQLPG